MTDFADHLKRKVDMDNCLVCSKPTKSHVVLIGYVDGDMVAVESMDDADGFGAVCHTCYRDADGDADKVAALYNERLEAVLDAMGVDKETIAKNPDEVSGYEYECSACGDHVPSEDVVDHREQHDEAEVSYTRVDLNE